MITSRNQHFTRLMPPLPLHLGLVRVRAEQEDRDLFDQIRRFTLGDHFRDD